MSDDNITQSVELDNDTTRTVVFHVHEDQAAEILRQFDVPLPSAIELDEIRIVIIH